MAFLGSFGKFLGNVAKPILKTAPAAIAGFAQGGTKGAALSAFTALQQQQQQQVTPVGGFQQFGGLQAGFGGGYGLPQTIQQPMQQQALPVSSSTAVALTQNVFNAIVALAARLGIQIKSVAAVQAVGRRIVARLLRFARANPGLTILNLLTSLGLSAQLATELITWYTTSGKRRRRIRVTNVKALKRSVRRLEGFRRLSSRVEMALAHRGGGRRAPARRRCPRCRKSPCCC